MNKDSGNVDDNISTRQERPDLCILDESMEEVEVEILDSKLSNDDETLDLNTTREGGKLNRSDSIDKKEKYVDSGGVNNTIINNEEPLTDQKYFMDGFEGDASEGVFTTGLDVSSAIIEFKSFAKDVEVDKICSDREASDISTAPNNSASSSNETIYNQTKVGKVPDNNQQEIKNLPPLTQTNEMPRPISKKADRQTSDDNIKEQGISKQRKKSNSSPNSHIRLGICAMDKKARSKPMAQIISRLDENLFEIVFFGDKTLLTQPVEKWPICDAFIGFYSHGYPLEKAKEYVNIHKPFVINDLNMQQTLMDRRRVYDLLEQSGIDVPRHAYMNRDGYKSTDSSTVNKDDGMNELENDKDPLEDYEEESSDELIEYDDHIEINGVTIHKPFVEKPVDADDHNIAIYYPQSAGGGCKKLFRKVGNRSSEFYPDINEVRRDGSYIYEEFVETQGTDVKMYTVGPDYGHAEARKSPTVDGKVERDSDGKEIRFPVILTMREKEIARRIVVVFKQHVCGFDLLRVQEGDSLVSYVCDVNGFSFVKNSRKYYDDCAQVLSEHMLAGLKPMALQGFSALDPLLKTIKDWRSGSDGNTPLRNRKKNQSSTNSVGTSTSSKLFNRAKHLIQGGTGDVTETDLSAANSAATLQDGAVHVREIPDMLVNDPALLSASSSVVGDDDDSTSLVPPGMHQEELRCIIAIVRHGDRTPKQKLKVNMCEPHILAYFHKHSKNCKKDLKVKAKAPMTEFLETIKLIIAEKEDQYAVQRRAFKGDDIQEVKTIKKDILYKFRHMRDILERWKIGGLNRKLQIKPKKWEEFTNEAGIAIIRCSEVQLILKWGGNLTKLGERQSIALGQRLRHEMYPDAPGGGILRLHSTFRHDLKIKTSDEGRVMKTGAAFAKGLLELEGEIPPILISLVHKEKDSLHMLDPSGNKAVKKELDACKLKVNSKLQEDFDYDKTTKKEHETCVGPVELSSLHNALKAVGNPRKTLFQIRKVIGDLLEQLDDMLGLMASDNENKLEGGEGLRGEGGDEALSGIKLYKGETLLELTERWRLLHKKLYDEDTDKFDLSRVPDVHDNVRFDMLHNPHLGLTKTLENLYTLAKSIADCVVPQEYGTTVEEKKSVGNKMCRALLEKIKDDLIIARTDNQVDMRYMINMDYSADLPINTMGRRIRTRLYFTSESHLHTLLNVLRFSSVDGDKKHSVLSERGKKIIGGTPELCYLTHVVIRLFENTKKDLNDPKRFRIEILFSPGATATPLHMSELVRDLDSTRFETESRQVLSKDNLTCQEVEEYFSQSIIEGKTEDDDEHKDSISVSKSKVNESTRMDVKNLEEDIKKPVKMNINKGLTNDISQENAVSKSKTVSIALEHSVEADISKNERKIRTVTNEVDLNTDSSVPESVDKKKQFDDENVDDKIERMAKVLAKQYIWTTIATVSFIFGIGCLYLSRSVGDNFKPRRWR